MGTDNAYLWKFSWNWVKFSKRPHAYKPPKHSFSFRQFFVPKSLILYTVCVPGRENPHRAEKSPHRQYKFDKICIAVVQQVFGLVTNSTGLRNILYLVICCLKLFVHIEIENIEINLLNLYSQITFLAWLNWGYLCFF